MTLSIYGSCTAFSVGSVERRIARVVKHLLDGYREPTIFQPSLEFDCMYEFHLRPGLSLSTKRRSKHVASVREHMFIAIDENSVSA